MALTYNKDLSGLAEKQKESDQLLNDCLSALKLIIDSDIPALVKHKTIQEHSRTVVYRAQQIIDNAIAPSLNDQ